MGLPVHLSYLSFGAGTTSTPVATTYVDLQVEGHRRARLRSARLANPDPVGGHYCLQARCEWLDDANPDNNLGQENVNVASFHSPAAF